MKTYHYVECGLQNVYLVNGWEYDDSPYGKGVVINNLKGLHQCIGKVLSDKPERLTGEEFRFLRRELDLSQRMLGEIFDSNERTIRDWERGDKVPGVFDHLIRHMYMETLDESNTFYGLVERLKKLDVEWHEQLRLEEKENEDWRLTA